MPTATQNAMRSALILALFNAAAHALPTWPVQTFQASLVNQVMASANSTCVPGGRVWNNKAGGATKDQPDGATCGVRITWLESAAGGNKTELEAKNKVAVEFPTECGACWVNPPTPTTNSTCEPGGTAWNTKAGGPTKDQPDGATCGGRIGWLESKVGGSYSKTVAKNKIATQYPQQCGACQVGKVRVCVFDIDGTLLQSGCSSNGPAHTISACLAKGYRVAVNTAEGQAQALGNRDKLSKLGMPWYVLNDPGLYRYHPNNMGAAAGKVQNMYDIMGYTNSSKACSLLFDDIASNVGAVQKAGFAARHIGQLHCLMGSTEGDKGIAQLDAC